MHPLGRHREQCAEIVAGDQWYLREFLHPQRERLPIQF